MSEKKDMLVELRGIKLQFGDKVILDDINLALAGEEVLVIMGLSGSGKSTLLSLLTGLLKPNAGSVEFKGADLTRLPRPALNDVRTHIGMVYQNAALISSMSVAENIALPLQELSKKTAAEIAETVAAKLELVGLGEDGDKLPSELSGGMQKRAGLARALALDPELVLFDEPSAGLDPINSQLINDLIIHLRKKQKVASIVVTHEMESAFTVATRMAFLHEGKILLEGTPAEFRDSDDPTLQPFLQSYSNHAKAKE